MLPRRTLAHRPQAIVLAVCALLTLGSPAAAAVVRADDATGSELARAAVASCFRARAEASPEARRALLERGLADAERAVAQAQDDAKAHFALFCNLGRSLQEDGSALSAVGEIGRMKREIDRALALEPDFVDALAAKGAMLVQLPRLLGGDDAEGERLLRRAVALAPDHPGVRLELARALAERGDESAALSEARRVVDLAQESDRVAELREARELAAELSS